MSRVCRVGYLESGRVPHDWTEEFATLAAALQWYDRKLPQFGDTLWFEWRGKRHGWNGELLKRREPAQKRLPLRRAG